MAKSSKFPFACKICCAPTINTFYGVKSCESCKVFFKRNVTNQTKILKCDFDGQCEINITTRRTCGACRLKKCLDVGMCREMIRASLGKKEKSNNTQIQKLTTLNLLERDQSLFNSDQWIHISNLIHSYDEHCALPVAQTYMKELDSLPLKLQFKVDLNKTMQLIKTFYDAVEPFIRSNHDFTSLPIHDRSIVLHGGIDNVSCLSGGFIARQSGLITNVAFCQSLEKIYGTIPFNLTLTMISLIDQDINLVKLTLALFTFCTSNCTIFNENVPLEYITSYQAFLRIQNMYAELIWKYLLYKYTFVQAVIRFNHLVQCLIVALTIRTHLQTVPSHTDVVDSLIQKIEQQKIDIIED